MSDNMGVGQGVSFESLPMGAVYVQPLDDLSGALVLRKVAETRGAPVVNAGALAETALTLLRQREWTITPGALYPAPQLIALMAGASSSVQHDYANVETKAQRATRETKAAALAGAYGVREALAGMSYADFSALAAGLGINLDGIAGGSANQKAARWVDSVLAADPGTVKDARALAVLSRLPGGVFAAWKMYAGAIRQPATPARVPAGMVRGKL